MNTQAGDAESGTLSSYSSWDQSPSMNNLFGNLFKLAEKSSNSDLLLNKCRKERHVFTLHEINLIELMNIKKKILVCVGAELYITLHLFMQYANQFRFSKPTNSQLH